MTTTEPQQTIKRGTIMVATLTLISRILGFLREALTARLLGASYISDAYFVALRIPNLCRSIVAEGAFTAAFVPLFNAAQQKSKEEAQSFLTTSCIIITAIASLITIAGICYAKSLVSFFAPGLPREALELATTLTQTLFPFVIFITLTTLAGSVLTSLKIFGTASWAQIVLNCTLIAGALIAYTREQSDAAYLLSVSTLVGGVAGFVYQLPALQRTGYALFKNFIIIGYHARRLVTLMLPALLTSGVYQLSIFISTVLASCVGEGAVSVLFYADRVSQLPLGIFSISLGTVLLPSLSSAYAKKDLTEFSRLSTSSITASSAVLAPLCAYLFVMSYPLCSLFFIGGAFDQDDAIKTGVVLQLLSLGIFFSGLQTIMSRGFLATLNTKIPSYVSIVSLMITCCVTLIALETLSAKGPLANILASLQSVLPRHPLTVDGSVSIALGSLCGSISSFVLLLALSIAKKIPYQWNTIVTSSSKHTCIALVSAMFLALLPSKVSWLTVLLYSSLYGISVLGLAYLFRAEEILSVSRSLKKKILSQRTR